MPASPQFTLTATLQDVTGAIAVAPSGLRITLCGFGSTPPEIVGTSSPAILQKTITVDGNGKVDQVLWGNDQITPAGTTYCIETIDTNGFTSTAANYLLTGSGSFDLSSLVPVVPPAPPVPSGAAPLHRDIERNAHLRRRPRHKWQLQAHTYQQRGGHLSKHDRHALRACTHSAGRDTLYLHLAGQREERGPDLSAGELQIGAVFFR